jgi:hypothetical protein
VKRGWLIAMALAAGCTPQPAPAPPAQASAAAAADVARLADRAEIERVANAIDDAVDRKDWTAARSFFTDMVDADFSTLGGQPAKITADELVGNWKTTLPAQKPSFHLRGEPLITIEADTATMISRGYAWNKLATRPDDNLWEVWGVYEHHFVRTPAGWRVSGFKFTKTYERGDPSIRSATP